MEPTLLTLPELLKSYVDSVMATTSFEGVSAEQSEAFEKSVESRVSEEVMKIVLEHLSDEDFQTLVTAIEGGNLSPEQEAEAIEKAVDKVPEFGDKITAILIAIRPELTLSPTPLASETPSL